MEKMPGGTAEERSGLEKLNTLLGMFGTEKARDNFISLCEQYYKARTEQVQANNDTENYSRNKKVVYSPPRRAQIHNAIMEIIGRIATESKNPTAEQAEVLRDFASRENVAQAIKEYVLHQDSVDEEDDEDEAVKKKQNMSGPSYFHSLGREH